MEQNIKISVRNLHLHYGVNHALKDVSLDIRPNAVTAFIGLFGVAAALEGYCFASMNPLIRVALAAGGLLMIYPGIFTDIIGIVMVVGSLAFQYMLSKGKKAAV